MTAEPNRNDFYGGLAWVVALALAVFFMLALGGCRAVAPPQSVAVRTDTVRQLKRDSIYLHYTDTVRERTNGDTFYIETVRWRVEYRDRLRTDTVVRTDSVAVRQVVTVARMNGVQRSFFIMGLICAALLLLAVVYKVAKWVK